MFNDKLNFMTFMFHIGVLIAIVLCIFVNFLKVVHRIIGSYPECDSMLHMYFVGVIWVLQDNRNNHSKVKFIDIICIINSIQTCLISFRV